MNRFTCQFSTPSKRQEIQTKELDRLFVNISHQTRSGIVEHSVGSLFMVFRFWYSYLTTDLIMLWFSRTPRLGPPPNFQFHSTSRVPHCVSSTLNRLPHCITLLRQSQPTLGRIRYKPQKRNAKWSVMWNAIWGGIEQCNVKHALFSCFHRVTSIGDSFWKPKNAM